MSCHIFSTLVGIILQLLGVGYLVWQAKLTSIKLAKYKSNLTYDDLAKAIEDLAYELNGQFKQQMRGFLLVGAGSILQFYGSWPT